MTLVTGPVRGAVLEDGIDKDAVKQHSLPMRPGNGKKEAVIKEKNNQRLRETLNNTKQRPFAHQTSTDAVVLNESFDNTKSSETSESNVQERVEIKRDSTTVHQVSHALVSLFRIGQTRKPEDPLVQELSPVARAAYNILQRQHARHENQSWNLTKSTLVGELWNTPQEGFDFLDGKLDIAPDPCPEQPHDEFLPRQMGDLIASTTQWCDITSLSPPDGMFLKEFQRGLQELVERASAASRHVIVRLLFGNIVGTPIDCNAFIRELTKGLPQHAASRYLQLWVGSWRKGVSWNHSKIIAVDGKELWTGGHNLWTNHYCKADPVHDVSLRLRGNVAVDAHLYINRQWTYISRKQSSCWGHFVDQHVPDAREVPRMARVTVSEYPIGSANEFPPQYEEPAELNKQTKQRWKTVQSAKSKFLNQFTTQKKGSAEKAENSMAGKTCGSEELEEEQSDDTTPNSTKLPVLSIGRYGAIIHRDRPADNALVAMMNAAQQTIRLMIQDLGPMQLPGTNHALPGTQWPKWYLRALAKAIWERDVKVQIVLSNPSSLPGHLPGGQGDFEYGNGWTCVDCAAEIIHAVRKEYRFAPGGPSQAELLECLEKNLQISYIRAGPNRTTFYPCGQSIGLHAKHYIVDDSTCYVGSQNLYDCDLAEWGVILDSPSKVQEIRQHFWDKMWEASYRVEDCPMDQALEIESRRRRHFLAPDRLRLAKWKYGQRQEETRQRRKQHKLSWVHGLCCRTAENVVQEEAHGRHQNA